jgi:hypothetical protein
MQVELVVSYSPLFVWSYASDEREQDGDKGLWSNISVNPFREHVALVIRR